MGLAGESKEAALSVLAVIAVPSSEESAAESNHFELGVLAGVELADLTEETVGSFV